ncbi:unnamed protein product [Pleuronectes platessa]|uniref:Uncharacterized protein n=1 Tax=Pleuronectes platessa TaxID=8262 RepID=A0A9N7YWH3_PLEPL|nr:unnamed protein product [Pleuronectes platessa]
MTGYTDFPLPAAAAAAVFSLQTSAATFIQQSITCHWRLSIPHQPFLRVSKAGGGSRQSGMAWPGREECSNAVVGGAVLMKELQQPPVHVSPAPCPEGVWAGHGYRLPVADKTLTAAKDGEII